MNTVEGDGALYSFVTRRPDFFTEQNWLITPSTLAEIPFPIDVNLQGLFGGKLIALLRSDWSPNPAGSLIAMDHYVTRACATLSPSFRHTDFAVMCGLLRIRPSERQTRIQL